MNIDDQKIRLAALVKLDIEPDMTLSKQVRDERAAGRRRLQRELRESIAHEGTRELQRRFGGNISAMVSEHKDGDWWVGVRVTIGSKYIDLSDRLKEFPSDVLIAQVALVAG